MNISKVVFFIGLWYSLVNSIECAFIPVPASIAYGTIFGYTLFKIINDLLSPILGPLGTLVGLLVAGIGALVTGLIGLLSLHVFNYEDIPKNSLLLANLYIHPTTDAYFGITLAFLLGGPLLGPILAPLLAGLLYAQGFIVAFITGFLAQTL